MAATMTPQKPQPKPGPAPHKARLQTFDQDGQPLNSRTVPAPPEPEPGADETVMQAGHATRVFEHEEVGEEETGETSEATETVGDYSPEELTKLKELGADPKSPLAKSYIHAQRKLGEHGSTISALQQQVNDVLATSKTAGETAGATIEPSPDIVALQKQLDEASEQYHSNILDPSAKTHLKTMNELQVKLAKAELSKGKQDQDNAAMIQATKVLIAEYPGLVTNRADAAYIDATVEGMKGGPTLQNYKLALDGYAKQKGWTKPTSSATPNAEVDGMKEAASVQAAPAASGGRSKGKIWTRYELQELQLKYPEKYRQMQPQIMAAYKEGRVR